MQDSWETGSGIFEERSEVSQEVWSGEVIQELAEDLGGELESNALLTLAESSPKFDPDVGVIDVSSHRNNCGLFALTLGVKVALGNRPELRVTLRLPEFFETIPTEALQRKTSDTAEVGQQLRVALEQALLLDEIY